MLFFTLYSCQKDEFLEESGIESHSDKNLKFKFKNKTFAELNKETKFEKAYQKFIDKKLGNSNFEGRTIMEDQYGFTIDSSLVKEFSSELYTSYTFFITRDSLHNDYFENLVVEVDSSNTVNAVIIKYFLNSPNITYPEHKSFYLDANAVEITPINFNNDQSRISALGDCIGIWMCPWQEDHPATNVCVEENRGDLWLDTSMCDDSVGSSNGSSSNNNGSSSNSGGGTSNGGNGGTPPPSDYDGSDPDIHGNGGGVTTSPNTGCRGSGCVEFEDPEEKEDPCDKIAEQIANTNFGEKVDIVNSSSAFNDDKENGFSQNQNGDFTQLSAIDDGHSLDMPSPLPIDIIGFLHSHINSYYGVDTNGDGIEDLVKVIKMPSSGDIVTFLNILVKANANNIPLIDIYGSMYSSSGNYTLKFTGDINDVLTNINNLRFLRDGKILEKKYKQYFQRYGKQKAFLRFLKNEIGIDGVRLFKIKNSGTIKEKFLNNNENVDSENC